MWSAREYARFNFFITYAISDRETHINTKVTRKVTGDDWTRFRLHAKHVRHLTHNGSYFCETGWEIFDDTFTQSLRDTFPDGQVVPALRELDWVAWTEEDVRGMCFFVSPTTYKLAIKLQQSLCMPHLSDLREMIFTVGSQLTDIRLFSERLDDDEPTIMAHFLDEVLRLCPNMTNMATDSVVFEAMLAGSFPVLPDLRCLALSQFGDNWEENQLKQLPPITYNPLPAVREVLGDGLAMWNYLLPINGIWTVCPGHRDRGQLACYNSCAFVHSDLQVSQRVLPSAASLDLHAIYLLELLNHDTLVGVLRPLLVCKHLEELIIETVGQIAGQVDREHIDLCFALSDNDIEEMALAWSQLRVLMIRNTRMVSESTLELLLTQRAVDTLLNLCSRLRSVALTLHFRRQREVPAPHFGRMLESLDFGNSPIDDPVGLAIWLENVCPSSAIHWTRWEPVDDGYTLAREHRWGDMMQVLNRLQGAAGLA
jgi:hypothetical protein